LLQHEGNGFRLRQPGLVLVGQLFEGRPGAIEENFPARLLRPALEALTIDARRLVIVKRISDAVLVEPGTRLLHGVAVFDAVDGDWHDHSPSIVPGGFDVTS